MKPNALIYIPNTGLRKIKSIVNRFCNEESGNGIRFSFYLQPSENNGHILVFEKAIPFDLFCELLFKLDFLSEDTQQVRAYLNIKQKGNGLPAGCMIFVNNTDKSDFAAVDSKGNLYEDDAEAEPYVFRLTGKHKKYIPCREANHIKKRNSYSFFVTEEKARPLKRIFNKLQEVTEGFHSCLSGCLPTIISLLLFCYSVSLSLRTEDGKLFWYIILTAVVVGLLPITREKYASKFTTALFALVILTYIPNYHFPRYMEKRKAVIEKIHQGKGRHDSNYAKFRFENNDTFTVNYKVNEESMHVGDTCILNIGKGLWGMKVCRGVMCNGIQIWEY